MALEAKMNTILIKIEERGKASNAKLIFIFQR